MTYHLLFVLKVVCLFVVSMMAAGMHPAFAAVSKQAAIEKVKVTYHAKVLTAISKQLKSKSVYRIKALLPNGQVRIMFVDAKTGKIDEQ